MARKTCHPDDTESIRVSGPLDSWPAMFRLVTVDNIIRSSIGQYQAEWYRFFVAVPALGCFSDWPDAQEGRAGCIDLDPLSPHQTHKKASPLESIRIPTNVDSVRLQLDGRQEFPQKSLFHPRKTTESDYTTFLRIQTNFFSKKIRRNSVTFSFIKLIRINLEVENECQLRPGRCNVPPAQEKWKKKITKEMRW